MLRATWAAESLHCGNCFSIHGYPILRKRGKTKYISGVICGKAYVVLSWIAAYRGPIKDNKEQFSSRWRLLFIIFMSSATWGFFADLLAVGQGVCQLLLKLSLSWASFCELPSRVWRMHTRKLPIILVLAITRVILHSWEWKKKRKIVSGSSQARKICLSLMFSLFVLGF